MNTPTVGILGAGQLGLMLARAAEKLGIRTLCYDAAADPCAAQATRVIRADWDDEDQLAVFCKSVDVCTFEFENVPLETARFVAERVPLRPGIASLEAAQDRAHERGLFKQLDIPTPSWQNIETDKQLRAACDERALPLILKTRRDGYDGKGQHWIRSESDIAQAWQTLGNRPLLLDQVVPFERELSVLIARDEQGNRAVYPLNDNVHRSGILQQTHAPAAGVSVEIEQHAHRAAQSIADHLNHIGVLAVEFFLTSDGRLLANEIAPRVHNTGHWTIEGARTSQFENHIRAVTGMPLGEADTLADSVMLNIIGVEPTQASIHAIDPDAYIHLYQKQPRPGRKLGHLTALRPSPDTLKKLLKLCEPVL